MRSLLGGTARMVSFLMSGECYCDKLVSTVPTLSVCFFARLCDITVFFSSLRYF